MNGHFLLSQLTSPPAATLAFEITESKGIGHPDVLCDGIAESISFAYVQWCVANLGGALHHNFDKVMIAAGKSTVDFGRGEIVRPIRIQVAGRATHQHNGRTIPVATIVREATQNYLRNIFPTLDFDRDCVVESLVGEGHSQLVQLVENRLANDTVSCCATWPRSELEDIVYSTAAYMNGELFDLVPIGKDIKVSGYRVGQHAELFIAAPFLAPRIPDIATYQDRKARAISLLQTFVHSRFGHAVMISLNPDDDIAKKNVYLSGIGTSAEMGDDGCAGRGNRANGLISPLRPSSTPPAGKNPISHPGKVYNILAMQIAQEVVETIPEVTESRVVLFTAIGRPLHKPTVTEVAVRTESSQLTAALKEKASGIAHRILKDTYLIMQRLMDGYPRLY